MCKKICLSKKWIGIETVLQLRMAVLPISLFNLKRTRWTTVLNYRTILNQIHFCEKKFFEWGVHDSMPFYWIFLKNTKAQFLWLVTVQALDREAKMINSNRILSSKRPGFYSIFRERQKTKFFFSKVTLLWELQLFSS